MAAPTNPPTSSSRPRQRSTTGPTAPSTRARTTMSTSMSHDTPYKRPFQAQRWEPFIASARSTPGTVPLWMRSPQQSCPHTVRALDASLVCSVERTRCPVRDRRKATSADSRSWISPTMTTSGSWRSSAPCVSERRGLRRGRQPPRGRATPRAGMRKTPTPQLARLSTSF